jgi:hypothetical protein
VPTTKRSDTCSVLVTTGDPGRLATSHPGILGGPAIHWLSPPDFTLARPLALCLALLRHRTDTFAIGTRSLSGRAHATLLKLLVLLPTARQRYLIDDQGVAKVCTVRGFVLGELPQLALQAVVSVSLVLAAYLVLLPMRWGLAAHLPSRREL